MPSGEQRHSGESTSELTLPSGGALPSPLRAGGQLGRYRLMERIGSGGMGQVFKAIHPTMQRVVAVKIMAPSLVQDARARARFRREVQSAARLAHPNIVMAHDAAEEAGCCFLVMEYVDGRDAAVLLRDCGPPSVTVACEVIRQAALGLQHAHEQGMVHRDVKPGNLMVAWARPPARPPVHGTPRPGPPPGWPDEPLVKVLDFGLAQLQAGDSDTSVHVPGSTPLTREGHVVGTPEFMAPEQACDGGRTDIRSDIYSLGCTFYCLLTGRPPFVGPSLLEVMVQHLQATVPPVTQSRPDVPADVVAVLERMLAKRPGDRYQQPGDVAAALLPLLSAAPTAAVVAAGPPVNLFPDTQAAAAAASPTRAVPAPPAATAVAPPRPSAIDRAVTATARSVFGCFGLFLVVIASMVGGLYLLKGDRGPPAEAIDDGPRPGPAPGMLLTRFPAGRLEPSYGPPKSFLEVPRTFEMSVTEVTQEQFREFVRLTRYTTEAENGIDLPRGSALKTPEGGEDWKESAAWDTWREHLPGNVPVVCVSWEDAVKFCDWLSERENLRSCYQLPGGPRGRECNFQETGYRLPTEAEWEYAARANDRSLYPTPAEALLSHGWFRENSGGRLQPVGGRETNRRGLCDVWGNAWEWCWDRQSTGTKPAPSPTGPESGSDRVVRGGSSAAPAPTNPGQTRKACSPHYRANDLGFRVARTLPR